jgi:hypothetical protein
MGEWRYSSTILDLGTRWRWVVSFMPRPLYPRRKSSGYPMDRRLGGPQSRSGRCREEKHFALPGIEPGPSSRWLKGCGIVGINWFHNYNNSSYYWWFLVIMVGPSSASSPMEGGMTRDKVTLRLDLAGGLNSVPQAPPESEDVTWIASGRSGRFWLTWTW